MSAQKTNEEETVCSICLYSLSAFTEKSCSLSCQHSFHLICIQAWYEKSREQDHIAKCPNCRKPIKLQEIFSQQSLDSMAHLHNFEAVALPNVESQNHKCCGKGNFIMFIIFLLAWGGMTFLCFYLIQDLFERPKDFPIFSVGINAKGFFAIGVYAEGIVTIGIISVGLISVSLIGIGWIVFVGQIGGGSGFGIYQIGISMYCYISQVSIALWETRKAQLGYSIFAPMCYPEKEACVTCQ